MKTLAIIFFFTFAATFVLQTTTRAQSFDGIIIGDSAITWDSADSIGGNIIIGNTDPQFPFHLKDSHGLDSLREQLKSLHPYIQKFHRNGREYYYPNNGERYYMDIIPFSHKAKRMDGSNFWLLKADVPDAVEIPPSH